MTGTHKDRSAEFEKIWRAMIILQDAYGCFSAGTIANVVALAGIEARSVRAYVDHLRDLRAIDVVPSKQALRITNIGEAPPMPATAHATGRAREQALWTAMRALRSFRAIELSATSTTEDQPVTVAEASLYCKNLARAGYLVLIDRTTYRLLPAANTGPRAPMVVCSSNKRSLFDLNLMQTVNVTGRRSIRRAA